MKKLVLILCLILVQNVFASENITPASMNGGFNVEYYQTDDSLINVDDMKNKDKVDKAKRNIFNKKSKIKLDENEIMRQRALDYVDQYNNSLLPAF